MTLSQAVSMGSWPILGFFCCDETVRCMGHGVSAGCMEEFCSAEQRVGTCSGKDEEQWEQ